LKTAYFESFLDNFYNLLVKPGGLIDAVDRRGISCIM